MAAVLHHRDREVDRVAHIAQASRAAGAQVLAHHHTSVELHLAVAVEARPDPGVEQRLVLHVPDRRDRRGERSLADPRPADVARTVDGGLARLQLSRRD